MYTRDGDKIAGKGDSERDGRGGTVRKYIWYIHRHTALTKVDWKYNNNNRNVRNGLCLVTHVTYQN